MNVTEARRHWRDVVNTVYRRETRVVLEKAGIPVAALVSPRDLERLWRYDAQRAEDFAVLDRIGAAFADVPDEELEREVTRALAEARDEPRAERARAAKPA